MKISFPNDKVIIKNDRGDGVPIKAESIFSPRLNLDHYKSPAGNRNNQATKLKEKAKIITDDIIRCNVSRDKIRLLFLIVWNPSITYPIGQSFLSDKQLNFIGKGSLPKIYPACGYNRNIKKKSSSSNRTL